MKPLALVVVLGVLLVGAGCKKKPKPADDTPSGGQPTGGGGGGAGGDGPGIVVSGAGGGVVTNPGGAVGGGGGGGAAGAVRRAASRTEIRACLDDLKLLLNDYSLANDRMPTPKQTAEMVKQGAAKYGKMIDDGDVVIHEAKSREDVWAYEGKPTGQRVLVLTSNGVEDMDVLDLNRRLGKK